MAAGVVTLSKGLTGGGEDDAIARRTRRSTRGGVSTSSVAGGFEMSRREEESLGGSRSLEKRSKKTKTTYGSLKNKGTQSQSARLNSKSPAPENAESHMEEEEGRCYAQACTISNAAFCCNNGVISEHSQVSPSVVLHVLPSGLMAMRMVPLERSADVTPFGTEDVEEEESYRDTHTPHSLPTTIDPRLLISPKNSPSLQRLVAVVPPHALGVHQKHPMSESETPKVNSWGTVTYNPEIFGHLKSEGEETLCCPSSEGEEEDDIEKEEEEDSTYDENLMSKMLDQEEEEDYFSNDSLDSFDGLEDDFVATPKTKARTKTMAAPASPTPPPSETIVETPTISLPVASEIKEESASGKNSNKDHKHDDKPTFEQPNAKTDDGHSTDYKKKTEVVEIISENLSAAPIVVPKRESPRRNSPVASLDKKTIPATPPKAIAEQLSPIAEEDNEDNHEDAMVEDTPESDVECSHSRRKRRRASTPIIKSKQAKIAERNRQSKKKAKDSWTESVAASAQLSPTSECSTVVPRSPSPDEANGGTRYFHNGIVIPLKPRACLSWFEVIGVALYKLELEHNRVFFHHRNELCQYIDDHWEEVALGHDRTATWWKTVLATITTRKEFFVSEGKGSGFWGLRESHAHIFKALWECHVKGEDKGVIEVSTNQKNLAVGKNNIDIRKKPKKLHSVKPQRITRVVALHLRRNKLRKGEISDGELSGDDVSTFSPSTNYNHYNNPHIDRNRVCHHCRKHRPVVFLCSVCPYQYCSACLEVYDEHTEGVAKNHNWACLKCRNLCACSRCMGTDKNAVELSPEPEESFTTKILASVIGSQGERKYYVRWYNHRTGVFDSSWETKETLSEKAAELNVGQDEVDELLTQAQRIKKSSAVSHGSPSTPSPRKRKLRTADFDIESIVFPDEISCKVEPLPKPEKISVPTWREVVSEEDPGDESDSEEDISDEMFFKRHEKEAIKIRRKFAMEEAKESNKKSLKVH